MLRYMLRMLFHGYAIRYAAAALFTIRCHALQYDNVAPIDAMPLRRHDDVRYRVTTPTCRHVDAMRCCF